MEHPSQAHGFVTHQQVAVSMSWGYTKYSVTLVGHQNCVIVLGALQWNPQGLIQPQATQAQHRGQPASKDKTGN